MTTAQNLNFEIPGKCPSKKNMWHTGHGRIYADSAVEDYVNLSWGYIYKPGRKPILGPVSLDVCFLMDDKGDLDNKISTICDVLQKCKVIENDRQIRRINARREKVKTKESKTFINLVEVVAIKKLNG